MDKPTEVFDLPLKCIDLKGCIYYTYEKGSNVVESLVTTQDLLYEENFKIKEENKILKDYITHLESENEKAVNIIYDLGDKMRDLRGEK